MNVEKRAAAAAILRNRDKIIGISHRIHAEPELGHQEHQASALLAHELGRAGLEVDLGVCGLGTAFTATVGSGDLHVALCAEYDALPGIGHACGHNMIAAASTGAAIALAPLAGELRLTVRVVGTPAEEVLDRGGKPLLLERGAFDGVHAALMIHPGPFELATPTLIAVTQFEAEFLGRESHAAAAPELGVNAADAAVVTQVALGLLRQQLPAEARVHGIFGATGLAPNVIPATARSSYMVRTPSFGDLKQLKERVTNCFRAGALASGCQLRLYGGDRAYRDVIHDEDLASTYRRNAEELGREFSTDRVAGRFTASTDMGNVSALIPSIHPFIRVGTWPTANHQPEFAAACVTCEADNTVLDAATALAWTVIDIAQDETKRRSLILQASRLPAVSIRARGASEAWSNDKNLQGMSEH
jgi:amidohydrolase